MAQDLVGHRLREKLEEDRVVMRFPQRLACLRKRTHQALRLIACQSLRDDGVALVFHQAAQIVRPDGTARPAGEGNGRRVTAGGGKGEEFSVRRGPELRDRIGESACDERQKRRCVARRLGRALEKLRDHCRVSSRHAAASALEGVLEGAAPRARNCAAWPGSNS